jgi:hypothetical protein
MDVYECRTAIEAMGVLGKQSFIAVVMSEEKRSLSLRGMCQLALRRHPEVQLFLRGRPGSGPALREKLGVEIQVLPSTLPTDDVADAVLRTVDGDSFDEGSFHGELDFDVALNLDDDLDLDVATDFDEPTVRNPVAPGIDEGEDEHVDGGGVALDLGPAPPEPLFVGRLEPGSSRVLLMGLFAQDLTGRFEVSAGPAKGVLYFFEGNPVAVEHPDGDDGIREQLVSQKLIEADLPLQPPPGELLAALVERGDLTGDAMHEFLRNLVRERVLALAMQEDGSYRFFEDETFVHTTPLSKVNAFGLIFEARRRMTPPQEVMRVAAELADHILLPQPALGDAARKLRPFVRDKDLAELLLRPRTVRDLISETGLDDLIGTLVVMTLDDAKLVRVTDETPEDRGLEPLATSGRADPSLPEAGPVGDEDDVEAALRSEIFTLYMRGKPLKNPTQIFGVDPGTPSSDVEAKYKEYLTMLDPSRVPDCEAKALLLSRMDELRKKFGLAFELLRD